MNVLDLPGLEQAHECSEDLSARWHAGSNAVCMGGIGHRELRQKWS